MYIDAHCHLEEETYGDQLPAVIDRAVAAGLTHLIAVGATRGILGAQEAVRLAAQHDNIFATAGIHPHDAAEANDETMAIVEHLLSHPKVVALGEVGLDFFYDHSPKDVQTTVFEAF